MKYKLIHKKPTSESGILNDFTEVLIVNSHGFNSAFGVEAKEISYCAIRIIIESYGNIAEYLQIFEYNGIKFWVINDFNETVTMLLPEEY